MKTSEIRQKYLEYFKKKGHAVIPSCGLVPDNDPTTLFTSAGMQQMIPYLSGQKHPLGARIANSQKCLRTQDIEEVGDNRHTTFFEMLGNWSLNDFFKKEQLSWMFEFLTKEVGLDPHHLYVTAFKGLPEAGISRDEETAGIWKKLFKDAGIDAADVVGGEHAIKDDERIFYYDEMKNWWSRSGKPQAMPEGELGGPDSEIFWDFGAELKLHENSPWANETCHVNCDCGRFLEIGNNVFMEYIKRGGAVVKMEQRNVDFGGGLERVAAASQNDPDIFKIDLFSPVIETIERLSGKKYGTDAKTTGAMRVIADHIRSAAFLIGDGVLPSNKAQGYFARRLVRRAVAKGQQLGIEKNFLSEIASIYSSIYLNIYPLAAEQIGAELEKEETKFRRTIHEGLKVFKKMAAENSMLSGKQLFDLYQSFGFPLELSLEIAKEGGTAIASGAENEFREDLKTHQELSRTASAGMFKGGLADAGEQTTKLHTAAHLMLAALRQVLGEHVVQRGSNITAERLRFDFAHPEKMTPEQIKRVEDLVNEQIAKNDPVNREEMALEDARNSGAMGVFGSKYGERVTVYAIGEFSKEICGGPHVASTGVLGHFRIAKEESSSSGIRRIKAVLE
ncbi:MAG: alanine--tRNA ligase [Candidatus Pacebacteria bacterium]|jgi:alanyl-tRNA synthetase|nr:alanine--tRNA ligase [Candidatus Paceibacterota bacterium]